MEGNYVGRFGDTLRKLTALDASRGAFAPQQIGGADTAGAFSVAAPGPMEAAQPVQAQMSAPPQDAAGSAFGEAPAPSQEGASGFDNGAGMIDESGAMGGAGSTKAPTTWKDLVKSMPAAQKKALADQIESHVADLPGTYQQTAQQNGVTPRPHASRQHMALFLAEIAMRAAANRGTSDSFGEALAKGTIQTEDRRDALAMAETERQRKEAETRRLETREDTKDESKYKRDRADKLADDERDHKQALELERLRIEAQKRQSAGQNVRVVVDDQGDYQLIDLDTKKAIPVEKDVTETHGSRGQGTVTTTKKVPVKALPKTDASGLDKDTIVNRKAARLKELQADKRLVRSLTSQFGGDTKKVEAELVRRANTEIDGLLQSDSSGSAAPGTAGSGKVTDFNDL